MKTKILFLVLITVNFAFNTVFGQTNERYWVADDTDNCNNDGIAEQNETIKISLLNSTGTTFEKNTIHSFTKNDKDYDLVPDEIEYQALKDLYDSTNGENWNNNTNWLQGNTSADFATWYGLTVSNGDVTRIYIVSNNLDGNIPTGIGNLSSLTSLSIQSNNLSGQIPNTIGLLTNLATIQAGNNKLTSIPPEIGNLTNLSTLQLEGNKISGEIPSSIGNLTKLVRLFLNQNQLTGNIPSEIGNLTALQQLYLYLNQLSGDIPTEIGNLSSLTQLSIQANNLSGPIPNTIGLLTNLTTFQASTNKLTSIPPEIGNLTSLTTLELVNNQIGGEIPSSIGNLTKLVRLYLHQNQLTGNIPPEIGNLTALPQLYLYSNQLSGNIPTEIGNLSNLTSLRIENNQLTGEIPSSIGNLSKLTYLNLYHNQLSGSIPVSIGNLNSLRELHLEDNQLNGELPNSIGGMTSLINCYLQLNQLSGPIPDGLGGMVQLERLWLYNNQFTSIPETIGNLSNLTNLRIENNQLTGEIPSSIGNLSKLTYLSLYHNQLSGSIPTGIGNLNLLIELHLEDNQLNGELPNSIGGMTSLKKCYLQLNQLSGPIPDGLGDMVQLERLWLYNNQFTSIPNIIGNLSNLTNLNIKDNQLTGEIPSSICNLSKLTYLSLYGNQLNSCPELNLPNLYYLYINSNNLSFDDILPNLGYPTVLYSPQAKVGNADTVYLSTGDNIIIDLEIDNELTDNEYIWYKDGTQIEISNFNTFTKNNISEEDAGIYTCVITNPGVSGLTLFSEPVLIIVNDNRYWISDITENWDEPMNWSIESGGTPGASVPGINCIVIYDENGTGDCNIIGNNSIKDLTINTGYSGIIELNNSELTITNNININDSVTFQNGTIVFIGNTFQSTNANYDCEIITECSIVNFIDNTFLKRVKIQLSSISYFSENIFEKTLELINTGLGTLANLSYQIPDIYNDSIILSAPNNGIINFGYDCDLITVSGNLKIINNPSNVTFYSKVVLNGTTSQNITCLSPDFLNISVLELSNSNNIVLESNLSINDSLIFTNGKINIPSIDNYLKFTDNAVYTGVDNNKYVIGSVTKTGDDAFTFPLGKDGRYMPISISAPANTDAGFTAKYIYEDPILYDPNSFEAPLELINNCEYWTLSRDAGTDNVFVSLIWDESSCIFISDPTCASVALWDENNSIWTDKGNSFCEINGDDGTVTSLFELDTYGIFTVGSYCQPCFAQDNTDFQQITDEQIVDEYTVWQGKYYIARNTIIQVINDATLDLTNVDIVFDDGAGIDFSGSSNIVANNSVFRTCSELATWRGFKFTENSNGSVNGCLFINSEIAVEIEASDIGVEIINSEFFNCHICIYLHDISEYLSSITGNIFRMSDEHPEYINLLGEPDNTFFGVQLDNATISSTISLNNFVNSSINPEYIDGEPVHKYHGIYSRNSEFIASSNKFTNYYRSFDIDGIAGCSIENNDIEYTNDSYIYDDNPSYPIVPVRITGSGSCLPVLVQNNSIQYNNTINPHNGSKIRGIYIERKNVLIINNHIVGFSNGIFINNSKFIDIWGNEIENSNWTGIFMRNSKKQVNISGNKIYGGNINANGTYNFGKFGIYFVLKNDNNYNNESVIISDNCIFDTKRALRFKAIDNDENALLCEFPVIRNNFMYNYSSYGIYNNGFQGTIGKNTSNPDDWGLNSFISNDLSQGTVYDVYTQEGSIDLNYNSFIAVVSPNVKLKHCSDKYQSTTSCGGESHTKSIKLSSAFIREFIENNYPLKYENGIYDFDEDGLDYINNIDEDEKLEQTLFILKVLNNCGNNIEADNFYQKIINSEIFTDNNEKWLSYYRMIEQEKYENAYSVINSIYPSQLYETDWKNIELIGINLLLNNQDIKELSLEELTQLDEIDNNDGLFSFVARDMLQASIGNHDYKFAESYLTEETENESEGRRINLSNDIFEIYPNPANDHLKFVFYLEDITNVAVKIYNIYGKLILEENLLYNGGETKIGLEKLTPGIYMIVISDSKNAIHTSKFIKQ
ncbi:MAG: T9SS type A sorting domain-containing protein [Bacteroidales bacterium]|nr:T9SS type A sorting domain-containing protein [Bacteroidales bacterium]